jgi:hypothetical protein
MALLDKLKKKIQPADVGALERTLVAGQTGRAQQEQGPAASGLGAQIAQQQAQAAQQALSSEQQAAQQELATQQQLQAEAAKTQERGLEMGRETALADISAQQRMAGETREAREAQASAALAAQASMFAERVTNTYAETLKDLVSARGITEQDIFQEYSQAMDALEADKAAAELEQLGHLLAFSDKQYVDSIQRIAREQGMRDELEFKKQSQEIIMAAELSILGDKLNFERALNADDREFRREMAKMDLDSALRLAEIATKEANTVQMIEGTTDLSSELLKYYAGKEREEKKGGGGGGGGGGGPSRPLGRISE